MPLSLRTDLAAPSPSVFATPFNRPSSRAPRVTAHVEDLAGPAPARAGGAAASLGNGPQRPGAAAPVEASKVEAPQPDYPNKWKVWRWVGGLACCVGAAAVGLGLWLSAPKAVLAGAVIFAVGMVAFAYGSWRKAAEDPATLVRNCGSLRWGRESLQEAARVALASYPPNQRRRALNCAMRLPDRYNLPISAWLELLRPAHDLELATYRLQRSFSSYPRSSNLSLAELRGMPVNDTLALGTFLARAMATADAARNAQERASLAAQAAREAARAEVDVEMACAEAASAWPRSARETVPFLGTQAPPATTREFAQMPQAYVDSAPYFPPAHVNTENVMEPGRRRACDRTLTALFAQFGHLCPRENRQATALALGEIRRAVDANVTGLSVDRRRQARRVLDGLGWSTYRLLDAYGDGSLGRQGVQLDYLAALLWRVIDHKARIHGQDPHEIVNMRHSLLSNLSDCIEESGHQVCSVGIAQRLVSTVEGYLDGVPTFLAEEISASVLLTELARPLAHGEPSPQDLAQFYRTSVAQADTLWPGAARAAKRSDFRGQLEDFLRMTYDFEPARA